MVNNFDSYKAVEQRKYSYYWHILQSIKTNLSNKNPPQKNVSLLSRYVIHNNKSVLAQLQYSGYNTLCIHDYKTKGDVDMTPSWPEKTNWFGNCCGMGITLLPSEFSLNSSSRQEYITILSIINVYISEVWCVKEMPDSIPVHNDKSTF